MKRLFRNRPKMVYLITLFVLLFLLLLAVKARADQTLTFEAGSAMVRGETPTLGITISCPRCGPIGADWEGGFDLIGESDYRGANVPNVIQLRGALVDGYRGFELGLGFAYVNVPTPYTCQLDFHLLARYRISGRWSAQWRHSSSAGSCDPNVGRDILTLGYRF